MALALSSSMFSDANLRSEIISVLLGEPITNCNRTRGKTAKILSVDDFHKRTILGKEQSRANGLFIDQAEFFDPQYDCDFTNLSASDDCQRGGEPYRRPYGWYRIALKVKGKYPDGDAWLGTGRWRSHSVPGEWPVCYHGTSLDGAKGIIEGHYQAGPTALYGRGIYSTPDIRIAKRFATFKSQTTGKNYIVILQNRINPEERELCRKKDYWLISVPAGTSAYEEKEIVERSIRPYGILIKEVHDDMDSQFATEEYCGNDEEEDDEAAEDEDDGNAEEDDDSGAGASGLSQLFNWLLNLF